MQQLEACELKGLFSVIADIPAPAWSAMIAFAALLISYTVARFSIRNKQIDFLLYDHRQFDELQKKRVELLVEKKKLESDLPSPHWAQEHLQIEAEIFFDRFWSLQFDGFVGWFEGYIPTSLYKHWLFARWQEIVRPTENWTFAGKTMQTSLKRIDEEWPVNLDRKSFQSRELCKFLDLMKELTQGPRVDADLLLRKYGPHSLIRGLRWLFGAY